MSQPSYYQQVCVFWSVSVLIGASGGQYQIPSFVDMRWPSKRGRFCRQRSANSAQDGVGDIIAYLVGTMAVITDVRALQSSHVLDIQRRLRASQGQATSVKGVLRTSPPLPCCAKCGKRRLLQHTYSTAQPGPTDLFYTLKLASIATEAPNG